MITTDIISKQHSLISCQYILQLPDSCYFFCINFILNCSGTNLIDGKKHIEWTILLCVKHEENLVQFGPRCKVIFLGNEVHIFQILFPKGFNFCNEILDLFSQFRILCGRKRIFMSQRVFRIKGKYRNIQFNVTGLNFNGIFQCIQHNVFIFFR